MTNEELTAYVAEHENETVQHYVEALLDELVEHANTLDGIVRTGYSARGLAAMRKVNRVLLFVAVLVIAFVAGRLSN